MAGQQARLLGGEGRGADHRKLPVTEDELHAAVRQRPHPGPLAPLALLGQACLQIAEMAVDVQRPPRLGVAEGVEMLVARERARLVVQALHQPVEELAHANRLAKVPPGASGFRADPSGAGLDFRRGIELGDET